MTNVTLKWRGPKQLALGNVNTPQGTATLIVNELDVDQVDVYTMPADEFRDMLKLWNVVAESARSLLISPGEMFKQVAAKYEAEEHSDRVAYERRRKGYDE